MSRNVPIKAEVTEIVHENEVTPMNINADAEPPLTQSMAPDQVTSSSSNAAVFDDPTLLSALLENPTSYGIIDEDDDIDDEDDEIIREIDVYISPELANTMHLIQFPLQPASHAHTIPDSAVAMAAKKQKKKQTIRAPPPPLPVAAKYKPYHSILELDYKIQSASFSPQRQIPAALSLAERTFTSHSIPLVTHMALGLFDNTSSKIDLIPLHRILQMRPSFAHVDALFHNEDDEAAEQAKVKEDEKKNSKPIVFQKQESEIAVMKRKSSYAYKKANEDAEEWMDLDVHGTGSLARKEAIKRAHCPKTDRMKNLEFMKAGQAGGNDGYVRSLNYLPSTVIEESVEDFIIDQSGGNDIDEDGEPEWKKDLTTHVSTLLQSRGGMPVPYAVIRSRFQSSIPDEELIDAISASSVLVRGNFVLKSSLMALSNIYVENARDVILVLMTKYGFIQRARLFKAFQSAEDEMSVMITMDMINPLLELMGKKTTNGFEMKIDDDLTFEAEFSDVAKLHALFWDKMEMKLKKYITLYEEEEDFTDVIELNKELFKGE